MIRKMIGRGLAMSFAAFGLLLAGLAPAQAKWVKVESSQFVVYTDGGEKDARELIGDLHEFDGLLRMFSGTKLPPSPAKLPIYLVRNNKEIREIAPRVGPLTAGFYRATPLGTIAVGQREDGFGLSARTVLLHEYAHYFMLHYYPASYPAWYVEGYAEYFAPTGFTKEALNVGAATPGRAYSLVNDTWDPIRNILAPAKGQKQSRQFYEESWLLTHFMTADRARRPQLAAFLKALTSGEEPEKALIAATGMDFDALDKALRAYLRKGELRGFSVKRVKATPVEIKTSALPDGAETMMLLSARLLGQNGATSSAEILAEVAKRAAKLPQDTFALETLAAAQIQAGVFENADVTLASLEKLAPGHLATPYLHALRYFAEGKEDLDRREALWAQARRHATAAYKLDQNHYQSLYIYAVTAMSKEAEIKENTLNTLLLAQDLAASVEEIRVEAAIALSRAERRKEAVAMLSPLANSPHSPNGAAAIRELIANIEDGAHIAQPLGYGCDCEDGEDADDKARDAKVGHGN